MNKEIKIEDEQSADEWSPQYVWAVYARSCVFEKMWQDLLLAIDEVLEGTEHKIVKSTIAEMDKGRNLETVVEEVAQEMNIPVEEVYDIRGRGICKLYTSGSFSELMERAVEFKERLSTISNPFQGFNVN